MPNQHESTAAHETWTQDTSLNLSFSSPRSSPQHQPSSQKKGGSARKFLRLPVPHLLDQRNCWEDQKHNLQGSRRCVKKGPPTWDRDGWKVYWQSARKVALSIKWCGSMWLQSDASQDKCATSRFDVVFKPKDVVSTLQSYMTFHSGNFATDKAPSSSSSIMGITPS